MKALLGAVLTLSSLGTALAADAVSPMAPITHTTEREGWRFAVSPYLWVAGLDGKMAQFGSPIVEVNESFTDILQNLDIGFMSIAEARNGDFSVFNDLQYSKVSTDATTPLGILAGTIDARSTTFSGLLGAGYTIAKSDAGFLDVAIGARIWSVDTELSFYGGLLDGRTVSDGDTWVDGLAGFRGNYNFTPRLYVTGWGLIGAGEADLDWDVAAGLGYRISDRFSSVLGYRALGVDYSNDQDFVFDVIQHGPILGIVARF
ncbi:hypothetical protein LA66_13865 [Aureimonas altamirensis]|uniref:Outer membrane protein beta-barrel domain-containing protein n=1 Tax=Aureimonas altamirensis TaxID=370622 RepID=A0A0B1Q152_9HYPH|nr:hypothetical protein [Aureimonas altamirensis]KHJ54518.1 hypothetical protein LA66_13865 [Aureimonas altamirensis]